MLELIYVMWLDFLARVGIRSENKVERNEDFPDVNPPATLTKEARPKNDPFDSKCSRTKRQI
jgi:hypothetical protein